MRKISFQTSRTLLALIILFTGFIANSQTAYDKLYWKGYNPGDMESINLDGTSHSVIFPTSNVSFGLEIDVPDQKLYWYDLTNDKIMKSDMDGTNQVALVPDIIDAQALSIDFTNHKLYWGSTSSLTIESVNLDGTGRDTLLGSAFVGSPQAIKVDVTHQKLYWFDHNAYVIKRINLDGTGEETFVTNSGNVLQMDIDEQNSKLYWPNYGASLIESINLDGTSRTTIASGFVAVGMPLALALDRVNNKVYWWDGDFSAIKRVNTDGTGFETFLSEVYSIAAMIVPQNREAVLPLTLVSLTGKEIAENVNLQWETAYEMQTAAFDIERSLNGVDFVKIGSIAAGTATAYSYVDSDPGSGTASFYRLKILDTDGKFTYSPIVSVKRSVSKIANGYLVYPNPATESYLYIKPLIPDNKEVLQIAVVDLGGRIWYTHKLTAANLNNGRFKVPIRELPHGVYVLQISGKNGEQVQVTKFTVGD